MGKLLLQNALIPKRSVVEQLIDQLQLMNEAEPNKFEIFQKKYINRSRLFLKWA